MLTTNLNEGLINEDAAEVKKFGTITSIIEKSAPALKRVSRSSASTSTLVSPENLTRRKVVVLGDGAIGKTSLLSVFSGADRFPTEYVPTVFDNSLIHLNVDDRTIELALWDTAGQDDYARLRPLSYPDTDVFMVCFAIDEPKSFENVQHKWIPEVKHYMPYSHIVLVGLREDLRRNHTRMHQCLSQTMGALMEQNGEVDKYVECSALKNEGTDEVLDKIARLSLMPPKRKKRSHQCALI